MSAPLIQGAESIVEIDGLSQLLTDLTNAGVKARAAMGRLLTEGAEWIGALSQESFVPIDTGALHDSWHYYQAKIGPDSVAVTLQYGPSLAERLARGGFSEGEYAYIVHEHGTRDGLHAKYLEIPVGIWLAQVDESSLQELTDIMWN